MQIHLQHQSAGENVSYVSLRISRCKEQGAALFNCVITGSMAPGPGAARRLGSPRAGSSLASGRRAAPGPTRTTRTGPGAGGPDRRTGTGPARRPGPGCPRTRSGSPTDPVRALHRPEASLGNQFAGAPDCPRGRPGRPPRPHARREAARGAQSGPRQAVARPVGTLWTPALEKLNQLRPAASYSILSMAPTADYSTVL